MKNKDIRLLRQMQDSAVSMPELAKKSQYTKQQIHYRLTEKWNELVVKESEVENRGAIPSTSLWRLSTKGQKKLESVEITDGNETEIETFDELSEIASEASRDAESAKNSVQEYRKKVSRIERRLDSLKESTGFTWSEIGEEGYSVLTRGDKEELRNDLAAFESDLESVEVSLASVETSIDEIESEHIEYLENSVINLDDKLSQLERRTNELKSENRKLQTELDTQRQRISDLEDELQKRKNRTLIERLSDMLL